MQNVQRVDLNLMVAFDALTTELSVTRAAERTMVGQPAMSASLARLRKLFDDPLLVRDGKSFVLTPVAESLIGPIHHALSLMDGALGQQRSFDPATDHQTFTVLASDYVLLVMLRPLLSSLATTAPNVRFNVRPISGNYADQVRRGQVDLFILPREVEQSGVPMRSEDLFRDRFVCAVDDDNTEVGSEISIAQFGSLPYLAYDGGPLPSAAQLQLKAHGIARSIDVTTQSFVAAPLMLRGTRFLALVHERLGLELRGQANLRLMDPPVDLEPITEAMFWSNRHDESPAHRWLRDQIRTAAATLNCTIDAVDGTHRRE